MKSRALFILVAVSAAFFPNAAQACSVCMGDANSNLAVASDSVFWTLLSLVGLMFIGTGSIAFYLYKRAHTPVPPHIALIESMAQTPEDC